MIHIQRVGDFNSEDDFISMCIASSFAWPLLLLLEDDKPSVPDLKKLVDGIIEVLKLVFPAGVPRMILAVLGWVLLLIILLGITWTMLWLAGKIKRLWTDEIGPLFDNPDQARRIRRRRLFARYLKDEIFRLNSQEEWGDHRFAELEATVEAEGLRSGGSLYFLPWLRTTGVRREKSLSRAIGSSAERLILLEGEPGAGKSVALRHVALNMAEQAEKSKRKRQVLPVYLNFKELKASSGHIDRAAIESFVLASLNRINDRDVAEFLEQEFSIGIEAGTWLFLFDSFDEIPQILSSVEPDATIQLYSSAVSDFLSGLNRCRGVIASRHFRGPKQFGWPKFTVLSLSEQRRNKLIRKADIAPAAESALRTALSVATAEMAEMSRNPMFLGLLCDYVRTNQDFPSSVHVAFDTYTEHRLTRDMHRLLQRFGLSPDDVRECAQNVAFCMSAEPGLGLSPDRSAIRTAMDNQRFPLPEEFESALDALEFIKLARPGTALPGESRRFTFAHRRFQEYFSTSVVLREPARVSTHALLSDGRWRETAVVMFQLQPTGALAPLLADAARQLEDMAACTTMKAPRESTELQIGSARIYRWPPRCLHLLGILQEGFSRRPGDLPPNLRHLVSKLLIVAFQSGDLGSRKYAVEVAGSASEQTLTEILRLAFQSDSEWLRGAAYRQLSHLKEVPDDIAAAIRLSIVKRAFFPRPRSEAPSIAAYLSRLNDPTRFMLISNVMQWVFKVDLLAHGMVFLVLLQFANPRWTSRASLSLIVVISYLLFRYHSIGKSVAAVSKVLPILFDWPVIIVIRCSFAFVPVLHALLRSNARLASLFHTRPDHISEAMARFPYPFSARLVASAAVLYLLLWAPATVWSAVRWGVSPRWTLLVTPGKLAANMVRGVRGVFGLPMLVGIVVSVGVVGGLGYVIAEVLSKVPDSVGRLLFMVGGAAAITGTVCALGEPVLRVWQDHRRWTRWQIRRPTNGSALTGSEFVDTWLSFETQLYRTRFVRQVRDSSLLMSGDETVLALDKAVNELQVTLASTAESAAGGGYRGAFALYLPLVSGRRSSQEAAAELLDELFIMLERMQQSRHGAGVEDNEAGAD